MCTKGIEFYFKSLRMGRDEFYSRYYRLRLKERRGEFCCRVSKKRGSRVSAKSGKSGKYQGILF